MRCSHNRISPTLRMAQAIRALKHRSPVCASRPLIRVVIPIIRVLPAALRAVTRHNSALRPPLSALERSEGGLGVRGGELLQGVGGVFRSGKAMREPACLPRGIDVCLCIVEEEVFLRVKC